MHLKMRESSVQRVYGRRAGLFVTSQKFDYFKRQLLRIASSARSILEVAFVSTFVGARTQTRFSATRTYLCSALSPDPIQNKFTDNWDPEGYALGEGAS
jgi:hypothetical protein